MVVPNSTMFNWINELQKWAPGVDIVTIHRGRSNRAHALAKVKEEGGIAITTFGTVQQGHIDKDITWECILVDEGHLLKNDKSQVREEVAKLPGTRFLLSGTPIVNTLMDLWSSVDISTRGQISGPAKLFQKNFKNPIEVASISQPGTIKKACERSVDAIHQAQFFIAQKSGRVRISRKDLLIPVDEKARFDPLDINDGSTISTLSQDTVQQGSFNKRS